jgi:hypothetical protein
MAGASAVVLQAKGNYLGHRDSINHRFLTREIPANIQARFVPRERRPEINASIEGRSTPPVQHLVPLRPRGLKFSPH